MPTDLHDLLTRATPKSVDEPDIKQAWTKGRRQRARRIGSVVVLTCTVALLAGATYLARSGSPAPHVAVPPANSTSYVDHAHAVVVTIPDGWDRSTVPLTPYVSDPAELLSLGTVPLTDTGQGPACDAQLPKGTIDSLGPHDLYVLIAEAQSSGQLPNPQAPIDPNAFPPRPASFATAAFQPIECAGPTWSYPNITFKRLEFTQDARVFIVFVALGQDVSAARHAQLNELLDSFTVLPQHTTTTGTAVGTTRNHPALPCHGGQIAVEGSDGVSFCANPPATTATVPGPDGRYYYSGPCPAGQIPSPLLAPPNCVAEKSSN